MSVHSSVQKKDLNIEREESKTPFRFVTAASLFDGHDAAINVMRRMIQNAGAEVVHLGHNRSVEEVVRAAIQEDADAVAISSYQGGHIEYFRFMRHCLDEQGGGHIKIFGGGGGTITPQEIAQLESEGITKIYHPNDGMTLGLEGMIDDLIARAQQDRMAPIQRLEVTKDSEIAVAQMISLIEEGKIDGSDSSGPHQAWMSKSTQTPVLGITGTGGAGKSSTVDEFLRRFLHQRPDMRIAVLAVDPTRRRTGGALLGDRIRMNSLISSNIYMRSIATRRQHVSTSQVLGDITLFLKSLDYDLILVETAGIGQSDSAIVDFVDFSIYIMTGDYGAASQLEKIDMIDYADIIILNKYDYRGTEDALRDVRKQWQRNRNAFHVESIPVYPTIASQFNDPGINRAFYELCRLLVEKNHLDSATWIGPPPSEISTDDPKKAVLIPAHRSRYLAEISEQGRAIKLRNAEQCEAAATAYQNFQALRLVDVAVPAPLSAYAENLLVDEHCDATLLLLRKEYQRALGTLTLESLGLLQQWPTRSAALESDHYAYEVRGRPITGDNKVVSLSGLKIPKIAAPKFSDWGEQLNFLLAENLPGAYPYTAGVFPYRRVTEDPIRMFAGEGTPEQTNLRFHYVSKGQPATRLSTAFDSVTLYGADPEKRLDIWGKIGNSGVSIATLDDMKKLFSGFNLCDPSTSVSMTINGPAPMLLAFFMNAAIDQQVELHLQENGLWDAAQMRIDELFKDAEKPIYAGELPDTHSGLGLALLGVNGDQLVDEETYAEVRRRTLSSARVDCPGRYLKRRPSAEYLYIFNQFCDANDG